MMKRKLTLFLSAVMVASSLPMTAYAANFKDINETPWAATAINNAADKGLVSGIGDNKYGGKNNVTYPEAMQMMYNAWVKSSSVNPMDAVKAYSYMQMLDTYQVPKWSQIAVAYGLENGLISLQDVAVKFAGGKTPATREDVAMIFGKALAYDYDVDKNLSSASKFKDYWRIDQSAAPLVDLLARLGILSGDNNNNFLPKNNINRAEMAVMLNKTYDILAEGVGSTGKIVTFENSDGDFFFIEVEWDSNGKKQGFYAKPDSVKAYDASGKAMALSRLSKGDEVRMMHNGDRLEAVYVTDGASAQEKYDITGYISSLKDGTLTLENENTGETDKYEVSGGCICYVEGELVKRDALEDILKENYNKHAYAGLVVEVEKEKNKNTGKQEYVTKIVELHVSFTDEYEVSGKVDDLTEKMVKFKISGSSNTKTIYFADNCDFTVNGDPAKIDELVELADKRTTYVDITVNTQDKAISVDLSEDAYDTGAVRNESKVLKMYDLTDRRIKVQEGNKDVSYLFDSGNPVENIRFYIWDGSDWDDMDSEDAINEVNKSGGWLDTKEYVYCKLDFNSGGKITAVEISDKKSAWSEDDTQNERKGTVESLEDGSLVFKNSKTEYEMLRSYNGSYDSSTDDDNVITGNITTRKENSSGKTVETSKEVKNPLSVLSAYTTSLSIFERMANDADLELYAEIISDTDGKVQAVEARLTKAVGTMVEWNKDAKFIKIETNDGEYKLNIKKTPTLTDEDEDHGFELEDLEGVNYAGREIELQFNSNGLVEEITVVDGPKNTDTTGTAKGIASKADSDGITIGGKSYDWMGKTSNIDITNHSGTHDTLSKIKDMVNDSAVEVYVVARLNEKGQVESLDISVRSAEGTIKDGEDNLIIQTEDGNTFSFYRKSKPTISVASYDVDDLKNGMMDGEFVKLTFENDRVSAITK